jgi:hypothetical protein
VWNTTLLILVWPPRTATAILIACSHNSASLRQAGSPRASSRAGAQLNSTVRQITARQLVARAIEIPL